MSNHHHQRSDKSCLSRNLDQSSFDENAAANVKECFGYENDTDAWQCYNGYPHGGGHGGVSDPIDSCNDPLFFMHRGYLDRLWWEWQMADFPKRLFDMGGGAITRRPTTSWPWLVCRSLVPISWIITMGTMAQRRR